MASVNVPPFCVGVNRITKTHQTSKRTMKWRVWMCLLVCGLIELLKRTKHQKRTMKWRVWMCHPFVCGVTGSKFSERTCHNFKEKLCSLFLVFVFGCDVSSCPSTARVRLKNEVYANGRRRRRRPSDLLSCVLTPTAWPDVGAKSSPISTAFVFQTFFWKSSVFKITPKDFQTFKLL